MFSALIEQTMDTQPETSTAVILYSLLIAFTICVAIIASVYIYRRTSKHAQSPSKVFWEKNKSYENDDSSTLLEDEIKCNYKGESPVHCIPMVPDWVKNRKEMVYPQKCIKKGRQLGSGQFGAVFIGKLIQGTAVYVMYNFQVNVTIS